MEKELIVRERLNRLSQSDISRQPEAAFDTDSLGELKRLQNPQARQKARFSFKLYPLR